MALVSCVSSTVMAAEYELLVYKSPVSKLNLNKLTLSDEYRIINTKNLFPNKSRLSLAKANITQTELLLVESDQSLEALMASIERLDGVSHVEPNYPLELYADYSDPDSYKQLNLIKLLS